MWLVCRSFGVPQGGTRYLPPVNRRGDTKKGAVGRQNLGPPKIKKNYKYIRINHNKKGGTKSNLWLQYHPFMGWYRSHRYWIGKISCLFPYRFI
jgi:hypothetical protein